MGPNTAAELAGRLNPKIGKLERFPTGIPQYTQDDIAGALGFMKFEKHRLWVHVAFSHHLNFYQALKTEILTDIVNKYAHERWDNRPGMLGRLIDTAVLETLRSPVCMTCHGQKSLLIDSRPVTCDSCTGSGVERMSDYWRARSVGIHRELWKRHWRTRYEYILDIIRGIDDASKSILAHYLTL